jgi:hypothetical protein
LDPLCVCHAIVNYVYGFLKGVQSRSHAVEQAVGNSHHHVSNIPRTIEFSLLQRFPDVSDGHDYAMPCCDYPARFRPHLHPDHVLRISTRIQVYATAVKHQTLPQA